MNPLLSLTDVCRTFPVSDGFFSRTKTLHALSNVSLDVSRGETIALVGESGSGKSTVAKIIARLLDPTSGTIKLGDELIDTRRRAPLSYRRRVQLVFQDPFGSLNPIHTVAHHIARPLLRHGLATTEDVIPRVHALLEQVELNPATFAERRPHEMSGGQRQRVAIARALALQPELVVADEPTSMLDVSIRIGVLDLLRSHAEDNDTAYVLITHDLGAARYFAKRIAVMYAGRIVEEGPTRSVLDGAAHPYTKLLLESLPQPDRPLGAADEDDDRRAGGAPVTVDPPPGCPFVDRCDRAISACREAMPEIRRVGAEHRVRCHVL
ncbi:MAG: ABC transporter ATP-binding protein [Myxococcota bacterium]